MRNFPGVDTTTLPRISQIDCLPQNRVNPDEFEQKRRADKIEEHKNQVMSQAAALKEQSYGRKRTQYPSGVLPPISQISMGGRQLPADGSSQGGLKLPPISQVSCLGGFVDDKHVVVKQSKSRVRETDSDFIKLSKAGGQKNLLHYVEANSTPRPDATDASVSPRTRYLPGFTSEADPRWRPSHWSHFSRRGQARSDRRLIWR